MTFYIAIIIIISGLIMVATNILYDVASSVIPIVGIIMVVVGILVGFGVAVKNTFLAYKNVYAKKGK